MRKKAVKILTIAALLSIVIAGIGSAGAYFSTYVEAKGMKQIHLGDTTTFKEEINGTQKILTVTNSSESPQAVWVRAKGFAPSASDAELSYSGDNWKLVNGYYQYGAPVLPGNSTDPALTISIEGDWPEAEIGKDFNVVVIYETTPAVQDGEDNYLDPDWDIEVTRTTEEG